MVILLIFTLIAVHFRRPGQHLGQLQDSVITLSNSEVELQSKRHWYLALSLDLLLFIVCNISSGLWISVSGGRLFSRRGNTSRLQVAGHHGLPK